MKVKGKLLQFNLYMLTKLQKTNFGKIKNLPHRGSNPHQLRNPYSTLIIILPQLLRLSPLDHTTVLSEPAKIGSFKEVREK